MLEEIQGDVYELFYKRVENRGSGPARRMFIWDVIRFFRFSNIKKTKPGKNSNNLDMIQNYFKVAFRNLLKQKLPTIINIFGLSSAIAVAIVAFRFLDWQNSLDSFHEHVDDIYQVTNFMDRDGDLEQWGDSPDPLIPAMVKDIPAVVSGTRIDITSGIFRYGDQVFQERLHFVSPEFLDVFSFPIKEGNQKALADKKTIIIREDIAKKYFGDKSPIGEEITITFGRKIKVPFVIQAVAEQRPSKSSFGFQVLIPYENKRDIEIYESIDDWSVLTDANFVLLKPGTNPNEVLGLMEPYLKVQNEANDSWPIQKFKLEPLATLSSKSNEIRGNITFGNSSHGNKAVAILALLLLLLACFNYVNIAVVSATKRLKEIGLRKVLGGRKPELVRQFLTENMLLCSFSLVVGTVLAYFLVLPGFNSLLPVTVPFEFSSNIMAIAFFGGMMLFTTIISGAYPAFYISSFNPISIFRGNEKFGRKSWITKILLTFQFFLAFTTIVSGFVFTAANNYYRNKDWGYNQENVLAIPIESKKHYNPLLARLKQSPNITSIAGSDSHVSRRQSLTNVEIGTEKFQVIRFGIGYNYMETMGFTLNSGRFFTEGRESDNRENVVVNESFVKKANWDNPLEATFLYDSIRYSVIGVVDDFHYNDFMQDIYPAFFRITPEEEFRYISMRIAAGTTTETQDLLKATWKDIEPDLPYDGFVQDEVFDGFFQSMDANVVVMAFVSGLSTVLACMGLFGLVSFSITKRIKEFSIRKVLGANLVVIMRSITRDFAWMLIIGMVLALPMSYMSMEGLLTSLFPIREPLGVGPFVWAAVLLISTAIVTVSSQIYRVAKSNPAENLRNE